jgi:hypothetical protein
MPNCWPEADVSHRRLKVTRVWVDQQTMFASSSFAAGQLVGVAILVLFGVGIIRTFSRGDLTWKQKLVGKGKQVPEQPKDDAER